MPREGIIPTLLGTAVTAAGAAMRGVDMKKNGMNKREIVPMIGSGILGFGLAHIVLGGVDLIQKRN
ncbi:MAG: asparagine synthase [Eubacteriales bacterium]